MRKRRLPRLLATAICFSAICLLGLLFAGPATAQQVTIATGLPSSASSGSSSAPSVITFCISNTRATPVTLKGVDNYMSTTNANTLWALYYSATSLSGQPNVTGWTLIDTVTGPTVSTTNIFPLFTSLNFSIPAATTYRFALMTTASIINYGGAAVTPNVHSVSNIDLFRGSYMIGASAVGYAGTASAPPFSPRFFCGTVYLDTAVVLCSGAPAAAAVTNTPYTAATQLCAGSTTVLNAADPNVGAGITYQWQSAPAATGPWTNVTGGSGATTLSYTTGPIAASTHYRVGLYCTHSNTTTYSAPFLVMIGSPQPGAITGLGTYCPGDTTTYTVPATAGGTYAWTLPAGWTGSSTTNSIRVTPGPGTTPQTISVTVTTSCGPASAARTRSIVPGSAPSPPAGINGNQYICGGTSQTYSVLPVSGANSYIWTLPSGWTGASTTNSITVGANSTSGTVSVRAVNGCGQSAATNMAVTVITALPNPGTITGRDSVCSGTLQAYSVKPVPGATSYVWTLPTGWSGTTTGSSIQVFPGTTSGTLRVTAMVACATSPVSDTFIVATPTVHPTVSISAPTSTLCEGSVITFTATSAFGGSAPVYQWKKNGLAISATGSTYTTNSLVRGDSISVTMTSNATCAASRTVVSNVLVPSLSPQTRAGVSINTVPPIVTCKGTPVVFTTTSTGTGATPSYKWYKNNIELIGITGTTYTDAALNDGDTIAIEMATSASCPDKPLAMSNKVGVQVNDVLVPSVSISVSPNEVADGSPLTFTASSSSGGATPDFQWTRNGVNIPFETGSTFTSSSLKGGDHIGVRMISYEPCVSERTATSNTIVIKSSLGVGGTAASAGGLGIYPNPGAGRFTVSLKGWTTVLAGEQLRLEVCNVLGQVVHRVELAASMQQGSWQTQIDLDPGLADGSYMLRLSSGGGRQATVPFLLQR